MFTQIGRINPGAVKITTTHSLSSCFLFYHRSVNMPQTEQIFRSLRDFHVKYEKSCVIYHFSCVYMYKLYSHVLQISKAYSNSEKTSIQEVFPR